jgi:AhpD family alkylhydroperoxidase
MEKRELIVASIAASVAAGCVKCLEYHKKSALAAGFSNSELLEIATLAFQIRDRADESNRVDLDAVLTGDEAISTQHVACCGTSNGEENKCS